MIIDFHTHSFPEQIAARVLEQLSQGANMPYYLAGTVSALQQSMKASGVDYSVLLPIATSVSQYETINRVALAINEHWTKTGILSFGSLHPDNENYQEILKNLFQNGCKGIKLHPVYQKIYIDDIRFLRILDYAAELGLIVLIHAGYDMGFPGADYAAPQHIKAMLDQTHPDKLILAHMGGWGNWDYVEEHLLDYNIYLDSSFCLTRIQTVSDWPNQKSPWEGIPQQINREQFCRIVRRLGADRILFGSDSPWTGQEDSITALKESGLNQEEQNLIFYQNAAKILGISDINVSMKN